MADVGLISQSAKENHFAAESNSDFVAVSEGNIIAFSPMP